MVRDPVCGMDIEEKKAAARVSHEGKTYYFCAVACREVFTRTPARYVAIERPRFEKRATKGAA